MRSAAWALAAVVSLSAGACTPAHGRRDPATAMPEKPASTPAAQRSVIDHVLPPRDSSGPTPRRFEWTAVAGADSYAVGIWNEVDVLVWRSGNLHTASVDWPANMALEPGTYFWSVIATRDEIPFADSGRAAFIVVR